MMMATALLVASMATVAVADTGSVVLYSYEKVILGNDVQWVLMPTRGKMRLARGTNPSPAVANGIFNELRDRKRATYGSTSLDISANTLKRGTATVKIDAGKKNYFPIIAAEVVYSLAQIGVTKVSFPGHTRKGMSRADVPFAVYGLEIPAWRALPPRRIEPAMVVLPGGARQEAGAFYKSLKGNAEDTLKMLQTYAKSGDIDQTTAAIAAAEAIAFKEWEGFVLGQLKHKESAIRIASLNALASQDKEPILKAISDVMNKDKDNTVTARAAEILGASKNTKFAAMAIYYQMRSGDEAAALKAIAALVKLGEPSAATQLATTARGSNAKVAMAAIAALPKLNGGTALKGLFEDPKVAKDRRMAAAQEALTLTKDTATRSAALTFLAANAPAPEAIAALETLRASKEPRLSIEQALAHPDKAVRHKAAALLADIRDPASLDALAKASGKAEDAEVMEEAASVIMAKLALQDVLKYTRTNKPVLKRVAYLALGQKVGGAGSKGIFDVLAKGVKSNDPGIRAASTRALGPYKDNRALKLVLSVAKDKDPKVRRAVALALGNWNVPDGSDVLKGYMGDSSHPVIAGAVESFGKRFEYDVYPQVLKLYRPNRHPNKEVRIATLKTLAALTPRDNEKQTQIVISVLTGGLYDPEPEVKMTAISMLGTYNHQAAVTGLASLINDPVERYRIASLGALGDTGSDEAIELVASVINDPAKPVRLAAVQALGELGSKNASPVLQKQIAREQDKEVEAAARQALKKLK
ncbi:MAG: HEAT repeat domain-containing protein [Myxococcota bacterium]